MNMAMTEKFIQEVQTAICQYIDDVGERKISSRTIDKIEKMHVAVLEGFYVQFDGYLKGNKELKAQFQSIKKRKVEKGADKNKKIEFNNELLVCLIDVADTFSILPNLNSIYKELKKNVDKVRQWNLYEQWIDWAIDFGDSSYLATHVAKLTHSSSKGSSIDSRYFTSCKKFSDRYITTPEQPKSLDTAYPDNKYSSISQFYNLSVSGVLIGDLLRKNGADFLCHMTNDLELLNYWVEALSKKIIDKKKTSYFLSKQIYFPIGGLDYHLLMPLNSSSLAHELHLEHKKRWDDPLIKSAIELSDKGKYSSTVVSRYPNKAVLHVTGSNHSNASSLNGTRGGRLTLMSALPPIWNVKVPSYKDKDALFSRSLAFALKEEIHELANYLLLLKNKQLSDSEPKRNAAILKKLREICAQLFNYIDTVNDAESDMGWSIASKLDIEYQLLFEPWRNAEAAIIQKLNNDWQSKIAKDFGRWLNLQMNKNKQLKLTPIQAALWTECFKAELREYVAIKEMQL